MASKVDPQFVIFLKRIRLDKYERSILELNVSTVEDLQDLTEQELMGMGMNQIEARRFTREVRKELGLVSGFKCI